MASFRKRMQRRGDQILAGTAEKMQVTANAINSSVVLATPVDKGQARGGWQASTGNPTVTSNGQFDTSGGSTIRRNRAVISAQRATQAIFIANNVNHIVFLNQGSSAQAPANFVERSVEIGRAAGRKVQVLKR